MPASEQPKTYDTYPYLPGRPLTQADLANLKETLPLDMYESYLPILSERYADHLEAEGLSRKGAERKAAQEVSRAHEALAISEQERADAEAERTAAISAGLPPAPAEVVATPPKGGKK